MKKFSRKVPISMAVSGTTVGVIRYSMCVLAAVLIFNTTSVAQQHNKSAPKRSVQSSAGSENAASNYRIINQNGKVILSDGKSETVVSNETSASSPVVYGDEIYYIGKAEGDTYSSGSSIYVYNVKTKATEDIIRLNSVASSYDLKNVVENLFQNKNSGTLYFSTSSKNRRGHAEFLTWKYDVSSKTLVVYQDGRIEGIDLLGNQTIVFVGFDSKGKFTSRSLVGTDGNLIRVLGKEYAGQTIK